MSAGGTLVRHLLSRQVVRVDRGVVVALVIAALTGGGCARPYAYDFRLAEPGAQLAKAGEAEVVEDADVRVGIFVDAAAGDVALSVSNKTDQLLQVKWADVTLTGANGQVTSLRPDVDLGWLAPRATTGARLVAVALPLSGDAAAAYEGQRFVLNVPVIVRREPRLYRYPLSVHVRRL